MNPLSPADLPRIKESFPQACSLWPVTSSDAFGNRQAGWNGSSFSGLWSPAGGWQHNTKEVDGFSGLTYMYQRWYNSADGRFVSRAPYVAHLEQPYASFLGNPVTFVDPFGREVVWPTDYSQAEQNRIQNAIDKLKKSCIGQELWDRLNDKDSKLHVILLNSHLPKNQPPLEPDEYGGTGAHDRSHESDGTGSDTTIIINDFLIDSDGDVDDSEVLVHEFTHAVKIQSGTINRTRVDSEFSKEKDGKLPATEAEAFQNQAWHRRTEGRDEYRPGRGSYPASS